MTMLEREELRLAIDAQLRLKLAVSRGPRHDVKLNTGCWLPVVHRPAKSVFYAEECLYEGKWPS